MITIPLTRGIVATIDDIDGDLADIYWAADKKGYAQRFIDRTTVKMHRVIMSRVLDRLLQADEQVDHINRNKSDNRRCNLRLANHHQNSANQDRKGKSKGIILTKKTPSSPDRWRARIRYHGKLIHLGYYLSRDDAIAAYNQAAQELFGEYAALSS
jgi:HNH endonuclease